MSYGERWTFGTFDIVYYLLLHCVVGSYVFILCMMFHFNVGYNNDDV